MTFTPIQPMEAPDYEESSKVLTNPMQAVFDSAAKDAETAETNANRNSQTAEALGAFSKSLNDLATTAADKYIVVELSGSVFLQNIAYKSLNNRRLR